jgi:hypothetical protein
VYYSLITLYTAELATVVENAAESGHVIQIATIPFLLIVAMGIGRITAIKALSTSVLRDEPKVNCQKVFLYTTLAFCNFGETYRSPQIECIW